MEDPRRSLEAPKKEKAQLDLFDAPAEWETEWGGMPEFRMGNTEPVQRVTVNFASYDDVKRFGEIIGQNLTRKTDSIWFPKPEGYTAPKSYRWVDSNEPEVPGLHSVEGSLGEAGDGSCS